MECGGLAAAFDPVAFGNHCKCTGKVDAAKAGARLPHSKKKAAISRRLQKVYWTRPRSKLSIAPKIKGGDLVAA
jgi:hypothetical protein